jgi:DNA-directed RNA polymerase I, II, and III subunit RPABC2
MSGLKTEFFDESNLDESDSLTSLNSSRKTKNTLSKYEATRILGARATLLSKGAQPLINPDGETDPIEIARMELNERIIPIVIRRYLPNGEYEDWRLQDLL